MLEPRIEDLPDVSFCLLEFESVRTLSVGLPRTTSTLCVPLYHGLGQPRISCLGKCIQVDSFADLPPRGLSSYHWSLPITGC
jgi:hypothetical protein